MIPGFTLMALAAILAWTFPVHSGLAGALILAGSSALAYALEIDTYSLGLATILPTEDLAGLLMVLYLFWKRPLTRAIPVTVVLVVTCVISVEVRAMAHPTGVDTRFAWGVGFLQLVLAVGTGMYLGGRQPRTTDTPMKALLRRQSPVMALLVVMLFLDAVEQQHNLPLGLVIVLGGVVMAGLAVFAPLRPVEAALLGALALVLTTVVAQTVDLHGNTYVLGPIPLAATVSGMLLLAFTARHAPKRQILWAGAALTVAALFALCAMPDGQTTRELRYPLVMGGLLLILSMGAGMYFRSRDEERSTATRAAVSHAQQVERMALARELHDVVAHHVTGIVVQAQAAQMVAEESPRAAKQALEQIDSSGTEALTAMRRLVASMRDAQPAGASEDTESATTNLEADLKSIVARASRARPEEGSAARIELNLQLDREIPPEVARSAMRVVQESLTNAKKYAVDATRIEILVSANDENLRTRITDDGMARHVQPAGGSGGYGLVGMRERVELLGGSFNAKPGDHVGWRVEAWLPLWEQTQEEEGI